MTHRMHQPTSHFSTRYCRNTTGQSTIDFRLHSVASNRPSFPHPAIGSVPMCSGIPASGSPTSIRFSGGTDLTCSSCTASTRGPGRLATTASRIHHASSSVAGAHRACVEDVSEAQEAYGSPGEDATRQRQAHAREGTHRCRSGERFAPEGYGNCAAKKRRRRKVHRGSVAEEVLDRGTLFHSLPAV